MATITISLSGSAIASGSKSYDIADATVQRLINAQKYYSGDGSNAAVLTAWADSLIDLTKLRVRDAERKTTTIADVSIT